MNPGWAWRAAEGVQHCTRGLRSSRNLRLAVDPIVRMEAARLRDRLREYYETAGQNDPIRIYLPKGTYTPQIEFRCEDAPRPWNEPAAREIYSTVPSVAVLAFDDLSAGHNLGYLGDGVAEDIITALSRFPDLVVAARTSSFTYKGEAVDIRRIGKEWVSATWSKAAYARTVTGFEL